MKRLSALSKLFALLSLTGFAQDPAKVAPQAYKPEFENDWVKVTRVHYAPHVKIPEHDHTETSAAYIYLNDSGPILFKHVGLSYGPITRPVTKEGSFRLYKSVKETHEVENPNDTPSDFMRVEFKTAEDKAKPLRGKFFREAYTAGENFEKIQFENEQIRAVRVTCARACEVSAGAAPALIVTLSRSRLKSGGKAGQLEPGKTKWIPARKKETIESGGKGHAEFVRFDLKGTPVKTDKEKANAHPHN